MARKSCGSIEQCRKRTKAIKITEAMESSGSIEQWLNRAVAKERSGYRGQLVNIAVLEKSSG